MVLLLSGEALPAAFWADAAANGGDLRVSRDADGELLLPLDVQSVSAADQRLKAWLRHPDAQPDQPIYLWYRAAGAVQPDPADPLGRNAVWADHMCAYAGGDPVDRAGNAGTLTLHGDAATAGDRWVFDGSGDYAQASLPAAVAGPVTLLCLTEPERYGDNHRAFGLAASFTSDSRAVFGAMNSGGGNFWRFNVNDGATNTLTDQPTGAAPAANVELFLVGVERGHDRTLFVSGQAVASNGQSLSLSEAAWDTVLIGSWKNSADYHGSVRFAAVYQGALGAAQVAALHANQANPATFWSAGAVEVIESSTPPSLIAQAVALAPATAAAGIEQRHIASGQFVQARPALPSPPASQDHQLAGAGVIGDPVVPSPGVSAAGHTTALAPLAVTLEPTLAAAAIGLAGTYLAAPLVSAATLLDAAAGQRHLLRGQILPAQILLATSLFSDAGRRAPSARRRRVDVVASAKIADPVPVRTALH